MRVRLLMLLPAMLLAIAARPLPPQLNDPNTTEGWIWQRVQAGDPADLHGRCGTEPLDARNRADGRWRADCRRVDAVLLRALLTQQGLADRAPHGVRILGAYIDGKLDLSDVRVSAREVWLRGCWIAGEVDLQHARFDGPLDLDGTLIEGIFDISGAVIDSRLSMRGSSFQAPVYLVQTRVDGQLAMERASVADGQAFNAQGLRVGAGGLLLTGARFGGPVAVHDARIEDQMIMVDASVADRQSFGAQRLQVGAGGLILNGTSFGGPLDLTDSRVHGRMSMSNASLAKEQPFIATGLQVGAGGLFLDKVRFGGPVLLFNVHVEGVAWMDGANIAKDQPFNASLLQVGAAGLALQRVTFGGPVRMRGAHVEGDISLDGASVANGYRFDAQGLRTGFGSFLLREARFSGDVALVATSIGGQMDMTGARVTEKRTFDAERLHVGTDLLARDVWFGGDAIFRGLTVNGVLDFRGAHVRQLVLEGAAVRNDFILGGEYDGREQRLFWDACDGQAPCLNLRNATIGNLQDDRRAWPERITLEGFTYARLGGIGGEQSHDMRNRAIDWWQSWLSRDPIYSAQPYAQLAGVLAAAGNRDGADDIRFFGRDRERADLLRDCQWLQDVGLVQRPDERKRCGPEKWGTWLGLTAQQVFVGYGIGAYNFRAAGWALGLISVGTLILSFAPGVRGIKPSPSAIRRGRRQKSTLWCFGASLHQVLPLVTISQEFSDFFNDPKRERLHAWQQVAFAALKLCGWVLGLFVAAAFTGLIQR